jgi:hypothetical protein
VAIQQASSAIAVIVKAMALADQLFEKLDRARVFAFPKKLDSALAKLEEGPVLCDGGQLMPGSFDLGVTQRAQAPQRAASRNHRAVSPFESAKPAVIDRAYGRK